MLTPVFYCAQDDDFVIVRLILSGMCKIANAVFDIHEGQFTFYCSPYYLRLRFPHDLQEGKGERATFDIESHTLTAWLPKKIKGEVFSQLDNPAFLLATEKERNRLITLLTSADEGGEANSNSNSNPAEPDEVEETEYVQTLRHAASAKSAAGDSVHYGFANHFSGLFSHLDEDLLREVVALPKPEITRPSDRHRLRLEKENSDFVEEVLLLDFEDEAGDVARVLRYVPAHMRDFQAAMKPSEGGGGRASARPPRRPPPPTPTKRRTRR
ncbi:unnamed protein product [Phytomonas sp. Hart1]|nr:unnamed protein product [Phytomonas sp. Hart1]|eukprot:CCW68449.1 unnamed protein product [Phytomonas sp. isolate Hart1]